ncbi:adenylosuccinate synthetase [Rhizobium laguerreae]|uniref:adenylosuccinate synthetase n=1 Tax=Rhizobium laguerreae TaxID=1076926 RepID=UPI001C90B4B3|nr:adenylosuccinate synthetase [Rhizobium laguerreae]MBY3561759.1 adenylosuccinate synthetase [Rhizobium laguerreae]
MTVIPTPTPAGYADVLVGLQYGDEGKARIIDVIASDYEVIARFNGGANAGHTVEHADKKISLHQVPSGVFHPGKWLYIGSGCVLDPIKLVEELHEIRKIGGSVDDRLRISGLASLVQPHHVVIDQHTGSALGTTGQGIGPAYADRANRVVEGRIAHLRVGDLLHDPQQVFAATRENLARAVERNAIENIDQATLMSAFEIAAQAIIPLIEPDTLWLTKLATAGYRILFEGAQSFMLDVVKGSVPFVTSSSTLASAAYVGGDLSPKFHRKTIGVAKAIMSRVGRGPFVSEFGGAQSEEYSMSDHAKKQSEEAKLDVAKLLQSSSAYDIGTALRIKGKEYGATTGRPRRIGAFDLVQLAYATAVNGVDEIYINKCDTLLDFASTSLPGIPIIVDYKLRGESIDYVPASSDLYRLVDPIFSSIPPFHSDISGIREPGDLPPEILSFVQEVEKRSCRIVGIGVGPARDQFVLL